MKLKVLFVGSIFLVFFQANAAEAAQAQLVRKRSILFPMAKIVKRFFASTEAQALDLCYGALNKKANPGNYYCTTLYPN